MAELIWSHEARRWLREIYDYISEDSPDAALRVVRGIIRRTRQLREFPESGQVYEPRKYPGVRMLVFGRYRILYLLRGDEVFILGVFHGALDLQRHLKLRKG